jgi:hypothetical protein
MRVLGWLNMARGRGAMAFERTVTRHRTQSEMAHMRRTSLKFLLGALLGLALAQTTIQAQPVLLLSVTNTSWRYLGPSADPGLGDTWKEVTFDDTQDPWASGVGLFGRETTAYGFPINTDLVPPNAGGGRTAYFRVHFNWESSLEGLVLYGTNYIDDGLVIHLNGQEAYRWNMPDLPAVIDWNTEASAANPGGEPVRVYFVLPTTHLITGDNVLAVEVHQSGNSSDVVFGMALYASQQVLPRFTLQPTNQTVLQCRSTTLALAATGIPVPTLQWYRGADRSQPIAGATGATLTINNFQATDEDHYFCVASNIAGDVESDHVQLTLQQDTQPPVPLYVIGSIDGTVVTITFDEPLFVDAFSPGAEDPFNYTVRRVDDPNVQFGELSVVVTNATNVLLALNAAMEPGVAYEVEIIGVGDACSSGVNAVTTPILMPVNRELVFQEGIADYTGVEDTELRSAAATTPQGDRADYITVDTDDGGPAHGLLRFNNLIGSDPGQIPFGSTILNATLTLFSTANNANGDRVNVHRMLVPWDEATATWNSFNAGVSADGMEAEATVEATFLPDFTNPAGTSTASRSVNVTASVQAWLNGTNNYGWALLPTGSDGYRMDTSEYATPENRPRLVVSFREVLAPVSIVQQPPAQQTLNERQPVTLSVAVTGSRPRFQWFKDNEPLLGATNPAIVIASAIPSQSGTYRCEIRNDFPSSVVSSNSVLSIIADTSRPTLVSAYADTNNTLIYLSFSEGLTQSAAENPGSYTVDLRAGGGALTIVSVVLTNGTNVVLTTSPRVAHQNYRLTVRNLTDLAVAANPIDPNPTVTNLVTRVLVLDWHANWNYLTNRNLDGENWFQAGYDDSAWSNGLAVLGFDDTAATLTLITNATGDGILTRFPNPLDTNQITYYFRTTFVFNESPAGVGLVVNHLIDDGGILYLNGAEAMRYRITNGVNVPVVFSDFATSGIEASLQTTHLVGGLINGTNVVAMQVKQNSPTSSDVVLGLQLLAVVPTFGGLGSGQPTLRISFSGGNVTLTWQGGGTLQQAPDLLGPWTDVPGTNGTYATEASGEKRFYRVKL